MSAFKFGSSPSARCVRSLTGKDKANDPRYRHRGRSSVETQRRRLERKLDKIRDMQLRKGARKRK